VYWPELLELEYPPEEPNQQTQSEKLLEEEEDWVEDLLRIQEEQDPQEDLQEDPQTRNQTMTQMLEEGEIPEILEEGEIRSNPLETPMIDSQTN
jgi:hypothetical protein